MKKSITFLSSILLVVLCMSMSVFAQQTTGELQGTVKDPAGAVIPNASVTISGVNVGFNQTIQTDNEGFFRARQLPPGTYRVTVAAISGFNQLVKEDVQVGLDNLTTLDLTVGTAVGATVNITSDSGVIVDPTETKAQDNISAREIELLPKGTGFTSLLRTSAAVRPEPISGQFSINGATGPENSFIIDGQETQNFRTGVLNGNNDIPYQAVQEIQVKSSGFEAEFGGATGGVINAVSKSGTNQLRGEIGANFATEKLNAGPRPVLNTYLAFGPEVFGSRTGSSQGVEYLKQERDSGHSFFPSATLGGPIIKDKLWFFGIYAPRTTFTERTSNFIQGFGNCVTAPTGFAPCRGPVAISAAVPALAGAQTTQTSRFKRTVEYAQFKLDASPFNTLRLSSSYTWNPIIDEGALLGGTFVQASPSFATFGGQSFQGADLAARQGGRQNSNNFRVEGNWTPNSRLVTTVRFSRGFLNEKLGSYGIPTSTRIRCRASGATAQATSGCLTGFQTTNNNFGVEKDVSIRNTVDANASYLAGNLGGRHEIKGGYQYSKISNDVNSGTAMNGGITHLYYYTPGGARPAVDSNFVCTAWSPTVRFAVPANAVGRGCNQQFQTVGQASNTAHTLFVQDKWQPTDRLTLNLGVRAESEKIPSFNGVS
ncbi:MAG TPA: TonB-dependent receptor, partial [Pyrinomonadaceae bacterium]|nr:TonB-dependent receptor [Pyrinomonadaceae bacterium]